MKMVVKSVLTIAGALLMATSSWAEKITKHSSGDWDEWYWKGSVSVPRGKAHTFWIKDLNESTAVSDIYVYYSYSYTEEGETWTDDYYASMSWDGSDASGSCDKYVALTEEDWEDIPGSADKVTFTVYVEGFEPDEDSPTKATKDVSFTFGHMDGYPKGLLENPQVLSTPSESGSVLKTSLVKDDACYFQVELTKGKYYKFWTTGGSEANTLTVYAEGADGVGMPKTSDYYDAGMSVYDGGIVVIPSASGQHLVNVAGEVYGGTFTLHYQAVGSRSVASHPATDLGIPSAKAVFADCDPARRNNPESGYYDQIIDDDLFKVSLKKGKYYKFWTEGAKAPLVMELYDSAGKKLLTNRQGFPESKDCLIAYKAEASADYWVGVCQDLEDDAEDELAETPCAFYVQFVKDEDLDDFDHGDDTAAGASPLVPALGTTNWKAGEAHGPHTLGATDWCDWFSIACRAGATYRVGALTDEAGETAALDLSAVVYAPDGKEVVKTGDGEDFADGLKFKADKNGTYFVKVSVAAGQGVDFGPYSVACAVNQADTSFGYLTVNLGGATTAEGAGWYIKADGSDTVYAPGTAALPAGVSYRIIMTEAEGWNRPTTYAWTKTLEEGETETIDAKYTDVYDPVDDYRTDKTRGTKTTKIAPSTTGILISRSLWTDDPADWMYFKTVANARYAFSLKDDARRGDATIVIYRSNAKDVVAEGTDFAFTCREGGVNYYAVVTHADAEHPADGQYEMNVSYVQPGVVGFKKTAYEVTNSLASVSLAVKRTDGKAGKVSVRYRTEDGNGDGGAKAGEDYLATEGVLTWENGETADKTVKVSLLPQLRAHYVAPRPFAVVLEPADVPEEEMASDEYRPVIDPSVAEVKVVSAVKAAPGTLQFAGTSAEDDEEPTSAKTTASVKAGERLRLWFSRTGGADGSVGLKVNTADDTAKAGTNYEQIKNARIRWADGQSDLQSLLLDTTDLGGSYQKDVKLTVKAAVDKTCPAVATLGSAKTLTVTIVDPHVTDSIDSYKKACKSRDGITVAETGTWFFNGEDELCNAGLERNQSATLTVTLTGPGRFEFTPWFNGTAGGKTQNTATYTVDKGQAVAVVEDETVVLDVASGSHTVKFTVKRTTKVVVEDVQLGFYPCEDGTPFLWEPLRAPGVVAPLAAEVVGTDAVLHWSPAGEDAVYRLNVNTTKSKLGKLSGAVVPKNTLTDGTSYDLGGLLKPGTTYYWRVDNVETNEAGSVVVSSLGAVQSFKTAALASGAATTMKTVFKTGAKDASGEAIEVPETGLPYEVALVQGLDVSLALATSNAVTGSSVSYAVVDSKNYPLPTGVTLSSGGKLTGYPTAKGSFTTLLQATEKVGGVSTPGETLKVAFTVGSQALAAGTFAGLLTTEDDRIVEDVADGLAAAALGSIDVTVASTPKVSGKSGYLNNLKATVKMDGKTYSFSRPSWTAAEPMLECGEPGLAAEFVCVTNLAYKSGSKTKYYTVTNRLSLVTVRASSAVQAALDRPMDAVLTMSLLDANNKVVRDVVWSGQATRKNTSYGSVKEVLARFAGYYTVSLVGVNATVGSNEGVTGNGYLTLTVAANGTAQYAGVLGDGATAISGSAVCAVRSAENTASLEDEVLVRVYAGSEKFAVGGWLRLHLDGTVDWQADYLLASSEMPVVVSDSSDEVCSAPLQWIKAAADTSYVRGGFALTMEPVGGYYDTVVNLQRYYYDLGRDLVIPSDDFKTFASDYLGYLLGEDEYFLAYPGMTEDWNDEQTKIELSGNSASVPKKVPVYRDADKTLLDWFKSTNPCNTVFKFTRATGIYTGSTMLYKGDTDIPGEESVQAELKKCAFKGVLLFSRDMTSAALENDNVAPGCLYGTLKVTDEEVGDTRSVKTSVPLTIRAIEKDGSIDD